MFSGKSLFLSGSSWKDQGLLLWRQAWDKAFVSSARQAIFLSPELSGRKMDDQCRQTGDGQLTGTLYMMHMKIFAFPPCPTYTVEPSLLNYKITQL